MLSLAIIFLAGVFAAVSPRRSGPLAVVVALGAAHFSASTEALFALLGLLLLGHFLSAFLADEAP
jgi:uncharacterized membrane protein